MIVTYYYPWGYFYPVHSGAATVAQAHLEYLRSRGFAPRIVLSNAIAHERSAFERHYHWVEDLVVIDSARRPEIHARMNSWGFGNHLAAHALLAECPALKKTLARPTDLVLLNYVFSTPLLDAVPRGAFRVLESHDLMAHQYVERGASPAHFQRLMATELSLYDVYDVVLMINAEEDAYARARGTANAAYVARPVEVAPDAHEGAAGEAYDLLFLGSNHAPNAEGAQWFYENIFEPLLKPHGLRWAIAGSVSNALPIRDPQVTVLGKVDDLDQVYRQSKVVVVPLFRGAGISIKTLEAMGRRKAVVTTPFGRRGLLAEADDALVCRSFQEDPCEVANAVLTLCAAPELREQYGRRAADFVNKHFGIEAYGRRMDELLAPLTGRIRSEPASAIDLEARDNDALLATMAAA